MMMPVESMNMDHRTLNETSFMESVIQEELTEDLVQINADEIRFHMIQYMYGKKNKEQLDLLIRHVRQDLSFVCRFFLYQEDFKDYETSLTNVFKSLNWNTVIVEKISASAIPFVLQYREQYLFPNMTPIEYIYLYYKHHRKLLLEEIANVECVQKLVQYCLSIEDWDSLEQIIHINPAYTASPLLHFFMVSRQTKMIDWILQYSTIDQEEIEYQDIYYYLLKCNHPPSLTWFYDRFKDSIPSDMAFFYQELCFTNNITLLQTFIERFQEPFDQYINEQRDDIVMDTYSLYEFLKERYSIPFSESILWKILLNTDSKHLHSFLTMIFETYPDLEITQFERLRNISVINTDVFELFEQRFPQCLHTIIDEIVQQSILLNNTDIFQWCYHHYTFELDFNSIEIFSLDLLCLMETLYKDKIPFSFYDYHIRRSIKLGKSLMTQHIQKKFPRRYQLLFSKYQYVPRLNEYVKLYDVQIQLIRHVKTVSEKEECVICYESFPQMYQSECQHHYCISCFSRWFNHKYKHECVYCRRSFESVDLLQTPLSTDIMLEQT